MQTWKKIAYWGAIFSFITLAILFLSAWVMYGVVIDAIVGGIASVAFLFAAFTDMHEYNWRLAMLIGTCSLIASFVLMFGTVAQQIAITIFCFVLTFNWVAYGFASAVVGYIKGQNT